MSGLADRLMSYPRKLLSQGPPLVGTAVKTDWRSHFCSKLSGHGLEMGALQRPMPLHEGMTVDYVDKLTLPQLRRHYPEHDDVDLLEPTIVDDAETLATVADAAYDFVIAAHVLEHLKNPLLALESWCRVLRPEGLIYLVVPDRRQTFDRLRVCTTLEHLILDYEHPSPERDYEHYLDYSTWVHGKRGRDALDDAGQLHGRDYSIHFHVFEPDHVGRLLEWFAGNIRRISVVEGPCQVAGSDEFHYLVRSL